MRNGSGGGCQRRPLVATSPAHDLADPAGPASHDDRPIRRRVRLLVDHAQRVRSQPTSQPPARGHASSLAARDDADRSEPSRDAARARHAEAQTTSFTRARFTSTPVRIDERPLHFVARPCVVLSRRDEPSPGRRALTHVARIACTPPATDRCPARTKRSRSGRSAPAEGPAVANTERQSRRQRKGCRQRAKQPCCRPSPTPPLTTATGDTTSHDGAGLMPPRELGLNRSVHHP